jgi:membrane protease YdiL (CAAX protease family)
MQAQNELYAKTNSRFINNLGHQLRTNKLAKVSEILIVFLLAFIFINLFKSNEADKQLYNLTIIWIANIIMLTLIWIGLKLRGQRLEDFGFSFKKFTGKYGVKIFLQSILVFILALAGFIIGSIIMANIVGIPESSDMSGYSYMKDNIWMLLLSLAGVYVVSSIGEEVVYRAFLINRLSELGLNGKKGIILTVILSAIIFGFAHYSWGPMGIVQTTFMGLVLGICYLYFKKRIWILILAHAYMDTILMVQMYLN